MKRKLLIAALLASAAMIVPAHAGGRSGSGGGGNFAGGGRAAARGGGAPSFGSMPAGRFGGGASFRSMPMRSFGGNRMIDSGQRFSSIGPRSPGSMEFRPRSVNSSAGSIRAHQFAQGNDNRVGRAPRFANGGNQSLGNARPERNGQLRNGQLRNGNATLRSDWRNHVFAQHSANWHRDWDRSRDHFFHGHRFIFIDGFWWGFDFGFEPWWGWPYWDPYYYYGYGYGYYGYPYGYDPSYYYGDQDYGQGGYADQYRDSTVAAAQQALAQQGYYRGDIDGVLGPQTQRAIVRYQSNHGLRVTGALTNETLAALGLRRVASY